LRKSQFSTLTYLNPGFGGPWDMLGIFFVNVKFITLHRRLLAKKNLNSMQGFKEFILAIFQLWQNSTFEPAHEIQNLFVLAERPFLKRYEDDIYKNYS